MHLYSLWRQFLDNFLGPLCSGPSPWSVPGLKCRCRCHLGCHVDCHLGAFFDPSTAFGSPIWLKQNSCEALGFMLLPIGTLFRSKRGTSLFRVAFLSRLGCRKGSCQGYLRLVLPLSPLVLNWALFRLPLLYVLQTFKKHFHSKKHK